VSSLIAGLSLSESCICSDPDAPFGSPHGLTNDFNARGEIKGFRDDLRVALDGLRFVPARED
jgi:hypothetical protein